jgi:hypothetical protein
MDARLPLWLHETAALEQRRHVRQRVLWAARLDTAEGSFNCIVLDVSKEGAKLQLAAPIPILPRQQADLVIDPMGRLTAEVIWQVSERMGLRFISDHQQVARVIGRALMS